MNNSADHKTKIMFLFPHLAFMVTHRIDLIKYLQENGYEIFVLVGGSASRSMTAVAEAIAYEKSISYVDIGMNSRSKNLFKDIASFFRFLIHIYRFKPNIIHAISTKPILFTSLASLLFRNVKIVCAISGLGIIGNNRREISASLLRRMIQYLPRIASDHRFIFQNESDLTVINRLDRSRSCLILGSGVNIPRNKDIKKEKIVLFASRMIKEKGLNCFCFVAKKVKTYHSDWRFVLAGSFDYESSNAVTLDEFRLIPGSDCTEVLGFVANMEPLYATASIILHPSEYGEGLSKTILQGMSHKCAVITSNLPGCADAFRIEGSGIVVEDYLNPEAYSSELLSLINNEDRLNDIGEKAQATVMEYYTKERIHKMHLDIYKNIEKGHCA